MESTDSSAGSQQPQQPNLPPGFRFHPTDEELVVHYLKKKTVSAPLPVAIIAEVDLYKFDPWELPAKATFGEQEWYFFSPRDRKYPNGARPNRAATSGYWKATGTDKPVLTSGGTQKVGVKKALVFYGGKPPKGIKTNWIMHEYRLAENKANNRPPGCDLANKKNSLRLDDWVLCRIYKKNNTNRPLDHQEMDHDSIDDMLGPINQVPMSNLLGPQNIGKLQQQLLKSATVISYGTALSENDHNLFDGMLSCGNDNGVHVSASCFKQPDHHHQQQEQLPMKRAVLPGMYWNDAMNNDNDEASGPGSSSSKRLQLDHDCATGTEGNSHASSLATMHTQLPGQTSSPLHQQTVLGGLGDGLFQRPLQLPGMNWFA